MTKTHFGFETVDEEKKEKRVGEVFVSIAKSYDLMNDIASFGLHRRWKKKAVTYVAAKNDADILDLASGTGDLVRLFLESCPRATVIMTDINATMLGVGKKKLAQQGFDPDMVLCNAERLPFPNQSFDVVSIGFGLRNVTHKEKTLAEMRRVLRPGGVAMILEFSQVHETIAPLYDFYSFKILPWLGGLVTKDETSYRYLAESIRVHPDQETLKEMMESAGFRGVEYYNMTFGVAAVHIGFAG